MLRQRSLHDDDPMEEEPEKRPGRKRKNPLKEVEQENVKEVLGEKGVEFVRGIVALIMEKREYCGRFADQGLSADGILQMIVSCSIGNT